MFYGINKEQLFMMLKNQDNKCPICKSEFVNRKNTHVDHNHTTGKVRELLCSRCNTTLGMLEENVETLKNMILYIEKHNESEE